MLSTLVGICQDPGTDYNRFNQAAALLDLGGSITMLVLGILALTGTGNLSISMMGSGMLLGGGTLTFIILAVKNMKRQDGKPTSRQLDDYSEDYLNFVMNQNNMGSFNSNNQNDWLHFSK